MQKKRFPTRHRLPFFLPRLLSSELCPEFCPLTVSIPEEIARQILARCENFQRTTSEFLMANRRMTVLPVALSLLASFMSAITLLGTPSEIYQYGTQYWLIGPSYIFVMIVTAHVMLPIYYRLRLTSAYEVRNHDF